MRRVAMPAAILTLVAVGAAEASVSAQDLAAAVGPPRLERAGLMITATGLLASASVYFALGFVAVHDRAALRVGALTGTLAGLIGGTVRAVIIRGAVTEIVARYAAVPDWFVPAALAAFVALSCAASALGGAALAWTGRRISRAARSRPPA